MKPDIIFENDEMIICNKKAGVLAQADRSFDVDMVSALMTYRRKKGEDVYIGVINRLDRPVSGLMVFAKSAEAAAKLNLLMQKDTFNKTYMAVVAGCLKEQEGSFTDYLIKNGRENVSRIAGKDEPGAKEAVLKYELAGTKNIQLSDGTNRTVSLVKIHLITGRHHQIRVQFASRDMVLAGDTKYAGNYAEQTKEIAEKLGIRRNCIALCACALDVDGKHFETEADFVKQFEYYRP